MSIAKARSLDLPELLDLITGLRMVTMGNDNAKSNLIARHNDTLPTIFTVLELVQHDDQYQQVRVSLVSEALWLLSNLTLLDGVAEHLFEEY